MNNNQAYPNPLSLDKQIEYMIHNYYAIGKDAHPNPWMNVIKDAAENSFCFIVPIEQPNILSSDQLNNIINNPSEVIGKQFTLDKDVKIEAKKIYRSDNSGHYAIPIFTSEDAMKGICSCDTMQFSLDYLFDLLLSRDKMDAIIINYGKKFININKEFASLIKEYKVNHRIEICNKDCINIYADININFGEEKQDFIKYLDIAYEHKYHSIAFSVNLQEIDIQYKTNEAKDIIINIVKWLDNHKDFYLNIFLCIKDETNYKVFKKVI